VMHFGNVSLDSGGINVYKPQKAQKWQLSFGS
jgi:hypothetical protein